MRAVRAAGKDLESRGRGPEFDDAHIGDYINPDGALLPSTTPAGFVVNVGGAYRNPEHEVVLLDPHGAISEVGEHIDPEYAP